MSTPWQNTTHDWASTVDSDHLARIRQNPDLFAPTGALHLILEVLAYVADEAEHHGLRFFDFPDAQRLPDGHPRRGMSVVTALSEWLVHTNRRQNGSWTQRYEHGIPATGLVPIANHGTTGTTVHFLPSLRAPEMSELKRDSWPHLTVETR